MAQQLQAAHTGRVLGVEEGGLRKRECKVLEKLQVKPLWGRTLEMGQKAAQIRRMLEVLQRGLRQTVDLDLIKASSEGKLEKHNVGWCKVNLLDR